jgi:hypothetical protein
MSFQMETVMQRRNFLALLLIGWLLLVGGCGGPAVVPTSYDSFADKNNIFKMQAPGGWISESGGNCQFASTAASGGIRGYRATAVNGDRRIQLLCTCPVAEWDALKPVFDKVIGSLSP